MSATNATPTINLPLFIGTDKPAWLTDWNGAMNVIDSAIASLQTAEGGTATALAALSQSVTALSDTVSQHTTAIQTVTTATAGNTGSINTINSLIGNGTPTTTDKTLIGAINELHAEIGGGDSVTASAVSYDNTSSGLTADDVQAAIDELAQGGTVEADDVSYSNTTSGLTATNVQAAIDEVAGSIVSGGFKIKEIGTYLFPSITAGQVASHQITFTETYASSPIVLAMVNAVDSDNPANVSGCFVYVRGRSATGCTLGVDNQLSSDATNIRVAYAVIEQ